MIISIEFVISHVICFFFFSTKANLLFDGFCGWVECVNITWVKGVSWEINYFDDLPKPHSFTHNTRMYDLVSVATRNRHNYV